MAKQISVVYFGKGEYALTDANADKLAKAVAVYSETGKWQWSLQDCLGIKPDGTVGKRFEEIKATLAKVEDDSLAANLLDAMNNVVIHSEVTRTVRVDSAEKQRRREEVAAILSFVEGLSEEEKAKMVKAV
jgi:type VI protein secretion system component VasK